MDVSSSSSVMECAVVIGGGSKPAAHENCEKHLRTTSATGETKFGGGMSGSYRWADTKNNTQHIVYTMHIPGTLDIQR